MSGYPRLRRGQVAVTGEKNGAHAVKLDRGSGANPVKTDPYKFSKAIASSPSLERLAKITTRVVPDVHWLLRRFTRPFASVLDVGCGEDTSPFRLVERPPRQRRTGLDHYAPALERSRAAGVHDAYILSDIFDAPELDKQFDCVVALDIVEHFEKEDGHRFLRRLEQIARRRVIVLTPNGFQPSEPFDDNLSQRHLSGWDARELSGLGYRVFGANGLKALKGDYAKPKLKPAMLWLGISMLTQYVTVLVPEVAYHLFAVKDLEG
jgi:SAM-dependent methyltransferase